MAWSQARAGTAGGPQTPARHPLISVTSGSSAWISPEVPLVEWNVSFRGLRWVIGSNEGGACSTPPPQAACTVRCATCTAALTAASTSRTWNLRCRDVQEFAEKMWIRVGASMS